MNEREKEQLRTQIKLKGKKHTADFYNTSVDNLDNWMKDKREPTFKQKEKIEYARSVRFIFNIKSEPSKDYFAEKLKLTKEEIENAITGKQKLSEESVTKAQKLALRGNLRTKTLFFPTKKEELEDGQAEYQVMYVVKEGKMKDEKFFGSIFFKEEGDRGIKRSDKEAWNNAQLVAKSGGCELSKNMVERKIIERYILIG